VPEEKDRSGIVEDVPGDVQSIPIAVPEKDRLPINITEPTPMPPAEEYEDTIPGDVPDPPSSRPRPETDDTAPLPALPLPRGTLPGVPVGPAPKR
jgi:hypothetical protein